MRYLMTQGTFGARISCAVDHMHPAWSTANEIRPRYVPWITRYDHFISNVDPDRSWLKIHSFLLLLLSAAPYFCLCLHVAAGCCYCCFCLLLPLTVPAYYSAAAWCCQLHAAALYPMHATTITHWNLYALQTTLPALLLNKTCLGLTWH